MEGKSRVSAPLILLIEFALALLFSVLLLHKYGNFRKQNPLALGFTLMVWFLSFVIISLLPIDVSSGFYHLCLDTTSWNKSATIGSCISDNIGIANDSNPDIISCSSYVCAGTLPTSNQSYADCCTSQCFQPYTFVCQLPLQILWYIIYWLFFALSWVILPLAQSYVLASYFSIWKKILRALIENALFYVTFFIIFVILFIYLVVVEHIITSLSQLPYLIATASNTWGLLILTLLLGYGLVEVPLTLWNASRRKYSLNHCYFKAAKLYTDMAEADEKLKEVTERVGQVAQSLKYNDPLRKYANIIIKKFPDDIQKEFSKGHDDYEDFRSTEDALSKSSLESLLKKTMKAVRKFSSSRIHWLALTDQTLDLEDVEQNAGSRSRRFKSSIRKTRDDTWYFSLLEKLEWHWKLWLRPWSYKVAAVLLGVLSFVIVWCEATFSIQQYRLSVFAQIIYALHELHDYYNYFLVEVISVGIVAYMSICTYFTVFRIKIFNLYYIAPRHSTDEYSLLFSAVLLSRLALPICLNYLYIIDVVRLNQEDIVDTPQTAFAKATGDTSLIPWLTGYFYIYYPIIIVLVCLATLLSLGTRLASLVGYEKFIGEDDFSADYIDEGKALMKRERRIRERNLREHGVPKSRDQLPFELLRESHSNSGGIDFYTSRGNRTSTIAPRQTPLVEDDSRFSRFIGKAKNLATRGKDSVVSKYHSVRGGGKKEDVVELLPANSSSEELVQSRGGANSRGSGQPPSLGLGLSVTSRNSHSHGEPPKDLFDDI